MNMTKRTLNQRERIRKFKILRPARLQCRAHKFHMKKAKGIKAKKSK